MKGIDVFASKYNTPVYAHQEVWYGLDHKLNKVKVENRKIFEGKFEFEDLVVTPVKVPHDVSCYGFSFSKGENKISVLTDLGHINDRILHSVKGSQLIYLEANYDPEMLMSYPNYPPFLKKRINGPNGHLSNLNCAKAIERLVHSGTRLVVLSHISEHSNTVNLAVGTIANYLTSKNIIPNVNVRLDIAHHEQRGTIFRINPTSKK